MLTFPPGPSALASKRSLRRGSSTKCMEAASLQASTGSRVHASTWLRPSRRSRALAKIFIGLCCFGDAVRWSLHRQTEAMYQICTEAMLVSPFRRAPITFLGDKLLGNIEGNLCSSERDKRSKRRTPLQQESEASPPKGCPERTTSQLSEAYGKYRHAC